MSIFEHPGQALFRAAAQAALTCPEQDCTEQLDSEYHLAQHLDDVHDQPELLYAMQDRYEEDNA